MKLRAAIALAGYIENPDEEHVLPNPLDKNVADVIAESIR